MENVKKWTPQDLGKQSKLEKLRKENDLLKRRCKAQNGDLLCIYCTLECCYRGAEIMGK